MYTIGDFIITLKNAALARKPKVSTRYSRAKWDIANILLKERYLASAQCDKEKKNIDIQLGFEQGGKEPMLIGAKIISRPSVRVYAKAGELKAPGLGLVIVSTSKGIMSAREALKLGLGGEVLARIW